jgi:hypothetical protein
MSRKDDLERYENMEARGIIQWLAAMKPSHEVQAPPDFRVKVLTRLEQRRARRRFPVRLFGLTPPTWVPALAVGLLLSLGANIWLGFRTLSQRQVASPVLENTGRDWPFDAYTFQAGLRSDTALGVLVTTHSGIGQQAVAFGFAAKPARAKLFIIGTLYAEALAYLHSGDLESARQRLATIEKELGSLQGPSSLDRYFSAMRHLLASQQASAEVLGEVLTLFEPLLAEYTRSTGTERPVLFRAGIWLESMHLAATTGDKAALRQVDTVQYFQQEMERLDAPQGLLEALQQISHITTKQEITDRDVKEVLKLVKRIQTLLS